MDVSIIICTYNRAETLCYTLNSLESMIVPRRTTWNCIVVDNNSSDRTRNVVEEFSQRDSLGLRYIFEPSQGKSFALNTGLKFASGEIIAFLDDDILVNKKWLNAVIKASQQYKDCDGFGGRIVTLWKTKPPKWLGMAGKYNSLRGTGYLRDDGSDDKEYSETANKFPCGANMFFRKRAIEENGPFRIDLGPIADKPGAAEDTEYCQRMLNAGKKLIYIGQSLVYHQVEPQKVTKNYLTRWRYYCARSVIRSKGVPNNAVRYFHVPRYFIKQLFQNLLRWNMSLDSKKRFYHKLAFCWKLGEIVESYKLGRNSCYV